jgi:hypothetical protein
MLFGEVTAVYSENHKEPSGAYSYHLALTVTTSLYAHTLEPMKGQLNTVRPILLKWPDAGSTGLHKRMRNLSTYTT